MLTILCNGLKGPLQDIIIDDDVQEADAVEISSETNMDQTQRCNGRYKKDKWVESCHTKDVNAGVSPMKSWEYPESMKHCSRKFDFEFRIHIKLTGYN